MYPRLASYYLHSSGWLWIPAPCSWVLGLQVHTTVPCLEGKLFTFRCFLLIVKIPPSEISVCLISNWMWHGKCLGFVVLLSGEQLRGHRTSRFQTALHIGRRILQKRIQLNPFPSVTVDWLILKIISVACTRLFLKSNIPNKEEIILSELI